MNRGTRVLGTTAIMTMLLAGVAPAAAQPPSSVAMGVTGRFAKGGDFTGTAVINRIEQRGSEIVAVGMVRGTLVRGNRTVASVLVGEVTWPVTVRAGGVAAVAGSAVAPGQTRQARWLLPP